MGLIPVPCTLMRGGTSRGVFFNVQDMPADPAERDRLLLAAMGSPHPLQVDGVGGGNPLTSKVAIVGRSTDPDTDIDYLFAQVTPEKTTVDTNATCGNILSAVGPFAIEEGLIAPCSTTTEIRIRNTNSGTITLATLETPGGRLRYDGDEAMPGIRPAAPIRLSFLDAAGALTGKLFPTDKKVEEISGVPVSLIDYAIPVMVIEAAHLGLEGRETAEQLDAKEALFKNIEAMRLKAGERMGLGDVSDSVVPKVALVSAPKNGGTMTSRYLTPWRCHHTHAVTGGLCLAAAIGIDGTIANSLVGLSDLTERTITIEHPSGDLQVDVTGRGTDVITSVTRTARLLFRGHVYVPSSI